MSEWDAATAEWYAERYGEYPTNRLALNGIDLPADGAVLDIGCGTAAALRHIGARAGRLVGVDPVPRMVEIAESRVKDHPAADRIELRVGAAEALPVGDGSMQLVLAFDSFDHWRDPAAGLAEVRRVLAPGGRFVVVKDGGVPDAEAGHTGFEKAADAAGFTVVESREMGRGDVRFTRWICAAD